MTEKKKLGDLGEEVARKFLEERGHTILQTQYKNAHHEVDLITFDSEGLHFVEVKTRKEPALIDPAEAVDSKKRSNLIKAAHAYLAKDRPRELPLMECFFDVVIVLFRSDGSYSVAYYPRAFNQVSGFANSEIRVY